MVNRATETSAETSAETNSAPNTETSTGTSTRTDGLIDAEALIAAQSVKELAARADGLVRSMEDPSALLAKPLSSLREAPDLLTCFGLLLSGLAPLPGMTILDFGAGSCWTSHFLTQLGCRVIAMDISEAMLDLGRRRYKEQPVFGEQPAPEFSVFDGQRMDLPDASVDRVLCFDALHHVANIRDVLSEMGRVLRPGGIAGFSEPGPNHSRDPQSQHEMRRYGVPERDLVIEDVWGWGAEAGFSDLSVAVFAPSPQWVPVSTFNDFLAAASGTGDPAEVTGPPVTRPHVAARLASRATHALRPRGRARIDQVLLPLQRASRLAVELHGPQSARAALAQVAHVRGQLANRRMFVLHKEGEEVLDSREATGLEARLQVEDISIETGPSKTRVSARCTITNVGRNRWLTSSAGRGAVLLGLRLRSGSRPSADHGRVALPGDRHTEPGETITVDFETEVDTPSSANERVTLELDLVSEGISWFAEVHGHPIDIEIPPFGG
jgi:SAM-dependent methyltransferase